MIVKFICFVLWIYLSGVKGLLRVWFGKIEIYLYCNIVFLLIFFIFLENFSIIFFVFDVRC